MNEHAARHHDVVGKRVVEALTKNGFQAAYCATKAEAAAEVLRLVPESVTVGVGGSWTMAELGVLETLKERGCTILNHNAPGWTPRKSSGSGARS